MLTINFTHLALKPGDTILDLGCGEGRHTIGASFHRKDIHIFAVDINLNDLRIAKARHRECNQDFEKRCLYAQANGLTLPFSENSVDHVVCSEVLEHIPDYKKILEEIDRVLKPGGSLNVSVPRFWPEKICWLLSRDYHQVEGGHIRIFNSWSLRQDIQKLAYQFQYRHWAHSLHVPYWWLRCAFWSSGESFFLTRCYHRLLVWDLLERPWLTRLVDNMLNPLMGKSVVMYFTKSQMN